MRKGKVTWKQVLALMLTAVMVLTAVPQSSMTALAAASSGEEMSGSDLSDKNVSGGDLSGEEVSGGDLSSGNGASGNMPGEEVSGGDVSEGDNSGGDISGGDREPGEGDMCLTVSGGDYDTCDLQVVTVSGNDQPLVNEEEHEYYIGYGDEVEITVRSKPEYRLLSVYTDDENYLIEKIPGEDGALSYYQTKFRLIMDQHITLGVSIEDGYSQLKVGYTSGGLDTFQPAKKQNSVYYADRRPLNFFAYEKNSVDPMEIGRAEILDFPDNGISQAYVGSLVDGQKFINCAWVEIASDLAGKDFRVALYEDELDTVPLDIIRVKAASVVKKVSVEGVKKGILSQITNLTTEYKLTGLPDQDVFPDEWKVIVYDAKDERGEAILNASKLLRAEITEQSRLKLTTNGVTGKATVLIYNESALQGEKLTEENLDYYQARLAQFQVEVKSAAWLQKQPTVKFIKASDTMIWFSIAPPAGFPKSLSKEDAQRYYYRVTAVEKGADPASKLTIFEPLGSNSYGWKVLPGVNRGQGRAANFQVTAQLCYVEEGYLSHTVKDENILLAGKESKAVSCPTKNPCLTEKITLKKKNTVLYTGQSWVAVAAVDVGKDATGIDEDDFEVIMDRPGAPYDAWVLNGILYVSAKRNILPGTYSVTVVAKNDFYSGNDLQPVSASIQFKILGGIAEISVPNDCEERIQSIYKQPGKAASVKLNPVLSSWTDYMPTASKKVTYSLGYMEGDTFIENKDILGKGMITLKNNVITINKKYDPDGEHIFNPMGDNRFCVKITAADFEENGTYEIAWFEIGTERKNFGKLAIVDDIDADARIHVSYLLDGGMIPIEVLDDAGIMVLRQDAVLNPEGWCAWEDVAEVSDYTLTSNQKLCEVWYDMDEGLSVIWADMKALGKTVTITATATDGSKITSKGSFKLGGLQQENVGIAWDMGLTGEVDDEYEYEEDYGLDQWEMMKPVKDGDGHEQTNYPFVDPADASTLGSGDTLRLRIAAQNADGTLQSGNANWGYSISVSGAKVQYDMSEEFEREFAASQYIKLIMTGKNAKITLKSGKKTIQTYTILNENYDKEKKAPKITLVKNQKVFAKVNDLQTLQFNMNQSVEGAVKVRVVSLTPMDGIFANDFFEEKEADLQEGATQFTVICQERLQVSKGKVSFVFLDAKGTPITHVTNNVSLKVEPLKKSFKLTEKCTLSSKNHFSAELKYVRNHAEYAGGAELVNKIQKGQANEFTKYFELDGDTLTLKLKEGLTELPGKTDLTGYVRMPVEYLDGTTETMLCKLTVNLKK